MSVNLCIDWGNTNIKVAIFENNKMVKLYRVNQETTLEEIAAIMDTHNPDKAILCSVADHSEHVEHLVADRIKGMVKLDGFSNLPINNAYLSNDTIGADRLGLVTAAHFLNPEKNNLVISLGTCITYNFITKNKTFRGGAISPGLQMRLKAMHHFTDRLPEVGISDEVLLLGYDTASCMLGGSVYGIACEIDGMLKEYESQYPDFNAILTGGDAPYFASRIKSKIFADPDLLLKGLNLIIDYNVPSPR